jgi:hypothetical protein
MEYEIMTDNNHTLTKSASHTSGPWKRENGAICGPNGRAILDLAAIGGESESEVAANASLIEAAPELLEAAETSLTRFAWAIDLVNRAVGLLNLDDISQEAIELLDEVTSSEYFKNDIEQLQYAIAEAKGLAA